MKERVLPGTRAAPGKPPGAGGPGPARPPAVTLPAGIRRLAQRGGRRLSLAIAAVLIAETGFAAWFAATHHEVDFSVYMWGGHTLAQDSRLYLVAAHGHWFTYPPFAAALFAAITAIPFAAAQVLWALASVAAFAVACHLTLKLAGARPSRTATAAVVAAGLALEPVYHTLFNGQINTVLLACVLADVWRVAQGRRAGIATGIAAAIKLTPGIFVLLFLLTRRTKAALTAMAAFAVCTLVGYLVAPAASRLYWTRFFYDTKRVDAPYVGNQSLYGTTIRLLGGESHAGGWYLLLPLAAGIAGLAVATVYARRGEWLTAAAVTGVTGLLISPVSWTHHWVWVLPALAVLARGRHADRVAAVCGYLLFVVAPLWWTPHSLSRPGYGFHWLVTLAANCYVVAGAVFIGVMAWRARFLLASPAGALPGSQPPGGSRSPAAPARKWRPRCHLNADGASLWPLVSGHRLAHVECVMTVYAGHRIYHRVKWPQRFSFDAAAPEWVRTNAALAMPPIWPRLAVTCCNATPALSEQMNPGPARRRRKCPDLGLRRTLLSSNVPGTSVSEAG